MLDFLRQLKQNRVKKRLKKERAARQKFLKELQNPGSTRIRHTVGPPR